MPCDPEAVALRRGTWETSVLRVRAPSSEEQRRWFFRSEYKAGNGGGVTIERSLMLSPFDRRK